MPPAWPQASRSNRLVFDFLGEGGTKSNLRRSPIIINITRVVAGLLQISRAYIGLGMPPAMVCRVEALGFRV